MTPLRIRSVFLVPLAVALAAAGTLQAGCSPAGGRAAQAAPAPAPIETGFVPTRRGRRDSRKAFSLNALWVMTITCGPRLAPRPIEMLSARSRNVPPLKATPSSIVRLR